MQASFKEAPHLQTTEGWKKYKVAPAKAGRIQGGTSPVLFLTT